MILLVIFKGKTYNSFDCDVIFQFMDLQSHEQSNYWCLVREVKQLKSNNNKIFPMLMKTNLNFETSEI